MFSAQLHLDKHPNNIITFGRHQTHLGASNNCSKYTGVGTRRGCRSNRIRSYYHVQKLPFADLFGQLHLDKHLNTIDRFRRQQTHLGARNNCAK